MVFSALLLASFPVFPRFGSTRGAYQRVSACVPPPGGQLYDSSPSFGERWSRELESKTTRSIFFDLKLLDKHLIGI